MQTAIFAAPDLELIPVGQPGSDTFRGSYKGAPVKRAFVINHGENCIVLLDPDSSDKPRFENLFCLARDGRKIWTAPLPETHDAFVELQLSKAGIVANSWSSFILTLDPLTGRVVDKVWGK